MAPDGNSSPSDDGNNVDAGDQSGLLYSSQQRGPSRVQQGSQQHRRGLPGSSREGPPPLASTGWEHQTRPGQHHEQVRSSLGQPQEGLLFSPPRQQQEGAFLFSGQQQERAFSPSEQQQERAFSPTVPARHEPILHERPYSRPGQAQFTSQPSTSANKSRTPQPQGRPQQQQQQPQETVGGTGGLESLMRMARLMPTPAMIASRRMAQSIGSGRVPGQAQNPQSVIIASILGRDVIIEAMSVPADGMNIANVGSSRVAEPGFAGTGGVPGTPGEVLGGGTATAHPSPLHFWEAGQQHGVASVHTDAYRTADQAVASGQGPSVTATSTDYLL